MKLLTDYLGLDDAALQELLDGGLVRHDGDQPHRLYTVTADGRDAIGESHREGIAHGDGEGDLSESSLHALMVAFGERYIEQEFVDDPDSAVVEAVSYHEPGSNRERLDAAGLEADGDVVVVLEAERSNNDLATAVPSDYDTMADCDPDAAIWLVEHASVAHEVLAALNSPADGQPRVDKTYSENSPPQQWRIDEPGFTDVFTLGQLRNRLSQKG